MNVNYICPACRSYLNAHDYIIFSAKTAKGERGLILLHPELGNYTVHHHPEFKFEQGEVVEFFCPVCGESLSVKQKENFAKILMTDESGKEFTILFSRVAGEKSTYKIQGESIEIFGKDATKEIDFRNLIDFS